MKLLFQCTSLFVTLTLLSGLIYPGFITGFAQIIWPHMSLGSLIKDKDLIVGSELIAQPFKREIYFWPRPSAANWQTVASGASNLGPTSLALKKNIEERRAAFAKANYLDPNDVPAEMLTSSGSGIDPHISKAAALGQIRRIIKARALGEGAQQKISALIEQHTEHPQLGVLGEERVNVLMLNLGLDECCAGL